MTQNTSFIAEAATWNERFATDDYVFGTDPNEYLARHVATLPPGGRVLCVADGEGRNSVWLARQGFNVEAFDISDVGVAKARRLAADSGVDVTYSVAGCDEFAWPPARYDGVVAIFVQFADPAMRKRLFAHMVDALKPGGTLILQGYSPKQLDYKTGGPGRLDHLYTIDLLKDAFAAMQIVDLVDYEAVLTEGTRHTGRSALIGLVARR